MIKNDLAIISRSFEKQKSIRIYAVADLHAGSIGANLKEWEAFNQMIIDDPSAYVIIIGDMMNNATKSSVSNCFDDIMRPRDQKIYLKEKLKPLAEAEKILAIVPGNHENRSTKEADDNPLYDVAAKLDLEDIYRENAAILHLYVTTYANENKHSGNSYIIFATHGDGGGGQTGSSVNKYERFASIWDGVDVFYFGHTHKPFITKPNRMIVDARNNVVKQRNTVLMTVPSWLQYGGYALRRLMSPAHVYDIDQPMVLTLSGKKFHWGAQVNW